MEYPHISIVLDMAGCPNRCKHCWIGHSPNGHLTEDDLRYAAAQFRPFAEKLTVYDWTREPDYTDDYRRRWALCNELSDGERDHFELISTWRIARDPSYAPWLASLGIKAAQLTLFGGQETTDRYTGRRGAYDDILHAINTLLAHGIAPRIQIFVNKDNVDELPLIDRLISDMDLIHRCAAIGQTFVCFMHQGSCDGENEKLYPIRPTPDDLRNLPPRLVDMSLQFWQAENIQQVFGQTEEALFAELAHSTDTENLAENEPVLYIDKDFNVYPNFGAMEPSWCLGNLKAAGAAAILRNFSENRTPAQHTRLTTPVCEMVKALGDPHSQRLFARDDYIQYLLNRYCRK